MKLTPGFYKVKTKDSWGRKFVSFHYIRIKMKGKVRYIQFDHGLEEAFDSDAEKDFISSYTIVKQIRKPIEVHNPKIHVEFMDEDSDSFYFTVRKIEGLDRIWKSFPRLLKAME